MKHESPEFWIILGIVLSMGYILAPVFVSGSVNDHSSIIASKASAELEFGFSTYLGGTGQDEMTEMAIDDNGDIYLAGSTWSRDFPTTEGAFDTSHNGGPDWEPTDCFVTKLSGDGQEIIYSTYIGGSDQGEYVTGIAVDHEGNVYITGCTSSDNFPTTDGAFDRTYNGGERDGFVAKLSANGSELLYSTYVGGSNYDAPLAIAIDDDGNCYVVGYTESADFPINTSNKQGSCHTLGSRQDGFVFKLCDDGSSLGYSMFLGGDGEYEKANAIAIDSEGNAIIIGDTKSSDFPLMHPIDDELSGVSDGFIAKVYPNGSFMSSTYLGWSDVDGFKGLSISSSDKIVLTGLTRSEDFPRGVIADQRLNGSIGFFLLVVDAQLTDIEFSCIINCDCLDTYTSIGSAIAFSEHEVWLSGTTEDEDFPVTEDALDMTMTKRMGYMTMIDPVSKTMNYSTFFGGNSWDTLMGLAIDASGSVYACGYTESPDIPIKSAIQLSKRSSEHYSDGFVFSLIREETLEPLPILLVLAIGAGIGILAVIVVVLKRKS